MILKEWLKKAEVQLTASVRTRGGADPWRDPELLLLGVLVRNHAWLLAHMDDELDFSAV